MKDYFQPKRKFNHFEEVHRVSSKKREEENERMMERERTMTLKKKAREGRKISPQ